MSAVYECVNDLTKALHMIAKHSDTFTVGEYGGAEIQYFILTDDRDAARKEFESKADALRRIAAEPQPRMEFTENHSPHENTVQHTVKIVFGSGRASYSVVWIEHGEAPLPADQPKEN